MLCQNQTPHSDRAVEYYKWNDVVTCSSMAVDAM